MPHIFTEEESTLVGRPITLLEIEGIMKLMAKDKGPGPDGYQ